VETRHRLIRAPSYMPLEPQAHKRKVAWQGENAQGGQAGISRVLRHQVVRFSTLSVARTGLRSPRGVGKRFDPLTVQSEWWTTRLIMPGAKKKVQVRITGESPDASLLAAPNLLTIWSRSLKADRRFCGGISTKWWSKTLNHLGLKLYSASGEPWDPVQMAAQAWTRSDEIRLVARVLRLQIGPESPPFLPSREASSHCMVRQVGYLYSSWIQ